MISGKKVIGVCITKIQDTPRSRTIKYLHEEATKHGFKLMLFNTSFDVTSDINEEIGVMGVFDFINYNVIDALIIFSAGFIDNAMYKPIIEKAVRAGVPVVLEDKLDDDCFTVRNSPEVAFEALINHVINDHGARDLFFVAGIKGNDYSEERTSIFKKVLSDNKIPFDDTMVDYGEFWDWPTQLVMDRLFEREKLPRAIICANDAMAITVCDRLLKKGIKVPEDVIVTGFDGSPGTEFSTPKITTCVIDMEGFSKKCIDIINAYFEGNKPEKYNDNPYVIRKTESCGCTDPNDADFKQVAKNYHYLFTNMNGHEYVTYNQIIYQLNSQGMDSSSFFGSMARILDYNAFLTLRPFIFSFAQGLTENYDADIDNEKLFIISSSFEKDISEMTEFYIRDIVPNLEEWANDDSLYVVSALQVGKTVLGFYEVQTDDIVRDSQKINRVLSIINMMIHLAVSDVRSRHLRNYKDNNANIDYMTELANLEGLTKWYEKFIDTHENEEKTIMLSVYQLPKYKFIYDNYGLDAIKDAVILVAETLRIANPKDTFIARVADDEFVVVNFYNDETSGANDIKRATRVFYGILDNFNTTSGKEYYIEVNSGCASVLSKEKAKIASLIRMATDELYENKKIYGTLPAMKEQKISSKEQYELFNTLISKNMFSYHFQPIVHADNGEIYGYEALMRTDPLIGFNPLEVLDIAKEYQRLYDIERATLFNVMERFTKSPDDFSGKKVFINCLPGHFLSDTDSKLLGELYSSVIDNFVFEITEHESITDGELTKIRFMGNEKGTNDIAVDDYGTGHSNLVNLIKYSPQIVKIDRFLMTDIHKDANKQMLVKGVIDFARANNIKVLAEGIETQDELSKVIEMGVDFIQGYYTGRPILDPVPEIDEKIKNEICEAYNKRLADGMK